MSQENSNNKLYYLVIALSVALLFLAAAQFASSQATSSEGIEHTIQVRGDAEKNIVPDTASLNIGVVVEAQTAQEATNENAALMNDVIEELKSIGLEDSEIQTSFVSVYPVYNYDDNEEALKETITQFARDKCSPYEVPKIIEIIEEMPLTAVGKIDKKVLQARRM